MDNLPPTKSIKTPQELMNSIVQLTQESSGKQRKRAVIVIPVLRVDGNGKESSPEIQEQECRKYAFEHGMDVVSVLIDLNETVKDSKRKGFRQLLKMIQAGDIDCILAQCLDRQFRNGVNMVRLYELLQKYDVEFISIKEQIDTRTFQGRFKLFTLAIAAELPMRTASKHCHQPAQVCYETGLTNTAYRLGYCNGLCSTCTDPNGKDYCPLYGKADRQESLGGSVPVPHPIEQHAIRLMAYSYHDHMSYKDISVLLNTHAFELPDGSKVQFRTKGVKNLRAPGKFTADAIRILIRNPFHAGYYPTVPFNRRDEIEHFERIKNTADFHRTTPIELHQGQHQPLYPLQIWEENQKIVSSQ